jgi:hypothetical protein
LAHSENFAAGDYIIIQTTSASRQWFFKDRPELANFYISDIDKTVSKQEQKAIESYIKYLDNDELLDLRYIMFGFALQHLSLINSDCRILILPGFHKVPNISGTLIDICNNEFISNESLLQWYDTHKIDSRPNHLSPNNHKVLGEKILEAFKSGILPDLTTNFDSKFL